MFVVLATNKDKCKVLDTDDGVVEVLPLSAVDKAKAQGLQFLPTDSSLFTVEQEDNRVSVKWKWGSLVESFKLPRSNSRNDLLWDGNSVKAEFYDSYIILHVKSWACCKYDYEFYLNSECIIAIPYGSRIKSAFIVGETKFPFYLTTDYELQGLYEETCGDCPSDCSYESWSTKTKFASGNTKHGWVFYIGRHRFDTVPMYVDLNELNREDYIELKF